MNHTIVALVEDKPGVLNSVTSMIRRRGFNIQSLAVGTSEKPHFSRMTFVVEGDETTVEQVTKQLNKLIGVVKVSDLSGEQFVAREVALLKVHTGPNTRGEILELVTMFRATIADISPQSVIIEITGDENQINALLKILEPFGVQEMIRTGRVAMAIGNTESKPRKLESTSSNGSTASTLSHPRFKEEGHL